TQGFSPSLTGQLRITLNGTAAQSISFQNSGELTGQCHLKDVEFANSAGVNTINNLVIVGSATVTAGTVTGSGKTAIVTGELSDAAGGRWLVTNTSFTGSGTLHFPAVLSTNATITGNVQLGNGINLTGNLTVTGSSAALKLNGNTVTVSGNFTVASLVTLA